MHWLLLHLQLKLTFHRLQIFSLVACISQGHIIDVPLVIVDLYMYSVRIKDKFLKLLNICGMLVNIVRLGNMRACLGTQEHIVVRKAHFSSVSMYWSSLQLDCPSVTHWDPCHNFCWRGPILIPRPVLESPAQTTRVNVLDFFVKPKNGISASFTKRR